MCGRYTLKTDRSRIEKQFGVEGLPEFPPRFNLAPAQDGLVVRAGKEPGSRTAVLMRWGLIPAWTRDSSAPHGWINARSETAAAKPSFRSAFRKRRCLVAADGFYERNRSGRAKRPFHFTVDHGAPFAMAGLWERWRPPDGEATEGYTILTTSANEILRQHHDRMPVIIEPEFYDDWLNPLLVDAEAVRLLLRPFPATRMLARAVNPRVNITQYDDPHRLDSPSGEDAKGPGDPPTGPAGQEQFDFGSDDGGSLSRDPADRGSRPTCRSCVA